MLHTADLNRWSFLLSLTLGYLWAGLRHRIAVGAAPTFQAVGIVPILLGCVVCVAAHMTSHQGEVEAEAAYAKKRRLCQRGGRPAVPQQSALTETKPVM